MIHGIKRTFRLFSVIPNKISLNLIKAHSDDCYFLECLEYFFRMGDIIYLPFSGEKLSENQVENLLPKSKLTLNYSLDSLETLTPMAKKVLLVGQ